MRKESNNLLIVFILLISLFLFILAADVTNPDVTIDSPTNSSYNVSSIDLNWSINEKGDWCAYSLDGAANDTSIFPPMNPNQSGTLVDGSNLANPRGVHVVGDYAYVAEYDNKQITIINVTDRTSPVYLSKRGSIYLDGANSIFVSGDYAYLTADNSDSFFIVNVTNVSDPTTVTWIINSTSLNSPNYMDILGNFSYITASPLGTCAGIPPDVSCATEGGGLTIINITNVSNPEQTYFLSNSSSLECIGDIEIDGDYAYIVSECCSMVTINITNVSNPEQVSHVTNCSSLRGAGGLNVVGDYLYSVSYNNDALAIFNVSDITSPEQFGWFSNATSLDGAYRMKVVGDYAYIGSFGNDSLTIIDVNNKSSPTQVGYITNSSSIDSTYGVDVSGDYTYAVSPNDDSLTIINITEQPTNVTLTSLSEGGHEVEIFCNDTSGNTNVTNVSFLVDTIDPTLLIVYPTDYQGFDIKTGINVNFSRSDANLETCWWSNSTGNVNITLADASADNITVGEAGDGTYQVYVWCNDTVNHIVTDNIHYVISLTSPAITLNHPTDGMWFDNGTDLNFNVTATDSNGISSCDLWGNWTGTWEFIKTNNSGLTSGTLHNITHDISEGFFEYNFNCTDTTGAGGWAGINFTFGIDETLPVVENISVTTTEDSNNVEFDHDIIETNQDSCWYSVYNSTGEIDIVNDVRTENRSVVCGASGKSVTVSAYATYNLTVYANDSAGNENSTTQSFTTFQSSDSPAGGGGGPGPETVTVIAIKRPPGYEGLLSSIQRARIYATFRDYFKNESLPPLAIIDSESKTFLANALRNVGVDLTSEELDLFLSVYNEKDFEEIEVKLADAQRFDLYKATLEIIAEPFVISPKRLDTFWFIINNRELSRIVRGNKQIVSCEVVEGEIGWDCEPKNSSAVLRYTLPVFPPSFSSKSILATISYTNEEGEVVFQDVNIRAISKQFLTTLLIIGGVVAVPSYIYRKKLTRQAKRIFKQIK